MCINALNKFIFIFCYKKKIIVNTIFVMNKERKENTMKYIIITALAAMMLSGCGCDANQTHENTTSTQSPQATMGTNNSENGNNSNSTNTNGTNTNSTNTNGGNMAENAGQAVDDLADGAGNAVKKAGEGVGNAVKDIGSGV